MNPSVCNSWCDGSAYRPVPSIDSVFAINEIFRFVKVDQDMFTLSGTGPMDPDVGYARNLADHLFEPILKSQAGILQSSKKSSWILPMNRN